MQSRMTTSVSQSPLTVLLPTYNRPAYLRSLLGYLAARRFAFPIRVLDSSMGDALSQNRETVTQADLNIVHDTYDPATPIYKKQYLGALSVETRYCVLCADDDIITAELDRFIDVLEADRSIAAVQGFYVNFTPGDVFQISDIVYWAPSISGADALRRICEQMGNYQAFSYAIHRTDVMKFMLSQLDRVQSLLSQELLSSALVLVKGGVHRLPQFFMARNTNESIATTGWHPHQFLATEPASLFKEYAAYRSVVIEHMSTDLGCSKEYTPSQLQRAFDLVHLKYLAPLLRSPVTDHLIDRSLLADSKPREMIEEIWNTYVRGSRRPERLQAVLVLLRRVLHEPSRLRRLAGYARRLTGLIHTLRSDENLAATPGRRLGDVRIRRNTRAGQSRDYSLSHQFLNQPYVDGRRISALEIRSMIEQLDDYV